MINEILIYNKFSPRYLSSADCVVDRDPVNNLPRITIENELCVLRTTFIRAFPFADTEHYISVMDGEGKEVGIFKSLSGMDKRSRDIIESELELRYFTPKVIRILSMRRTAGTWRIEVLTDRGMRVYYMKSWRDNAHEIERNRWIAFADDGSRFEIPNLEEMDLRSQALLDQLV